MQKKSTRGPILKFPPHRLVLACGNTLRGDDGVGWQIADLLELDRRFAGVEVVISQQFLPEHCELLSRADRVVFVDCSATSPSGFVATLPIEPAGELPRILTHHLDPASLLLMTSDLYGHLPSSATAVTVGAACFEFHERLSDAVAAAIPTALDAIHEALQL